jgi:hypothetical protein
MIPVNPGRMSSGPAAVQRKSDILDGNRAEGFVSEINRQAALEEWRFPFHGELTNDCD